MEAPDSDTKVITGGQFGTTDLTSGSRFLATAATPMVTEGISSGVDSRSSVKNLTEWKLPKESLPAGVVLVNITARIDPKISLSELKGYFHSLLLRRGLTGHYTIWGFSQWNYIYNYKFSKNDRCPLCKDVHDNYNFDYKVAAGKYAGWKCWKTGEWEQDYDFDALTKFGPPWQ